MAKNKMVKSNKVVFESDEKKSILIALVISIVLIIATLIVFSVAQKRNGGLIKTETEVETTETITEEITEQGVSIAANQDELNVLLSRFVEAQDENSILLQSDEEQTIEILAGDYSNIALTINAPYTEIKNSATFEDITINQIASNTWIEEGQDNVFTVDGMSAHFIINEESSIASISCVTPGASVAIENYGNLNNLIVSGENSIVSMQVDGTVGIITAYQNTSLTLLGTCQTIIPVAIEAGASGSNLKTSVPVAVDAYDNSTITIKQGAENSVVAAYDDNVEVLIINETESTIKGIDPDMKEHEIKANTSVTYGTKRVDTGNSGSSGSSSGGSGQAGSSTASSSGNTSSGNHSSGSGSQNSSDNQAAEKTNEQKAAEEAAAKKAAEEEAAKKKTTTTTTTTTTNSSTSALENKIKDLEKKLADYKNNTASATDLKKATDAAAAAKKEAEEAKAELDKIKEKNESLEQNIINISSAYGKRYAAEAKTSRYIIAGEGVDSSKYEVTTEYKTKTVASGGGTLSIENITKNRGYTNIKNNNSVPNTISIMTYYYNNNDECVSIKLSMNKTLYPNQSWIFVREAEPNATHYISEITVGASDIAGTYTASLETGTASSKTVHLECAGMDDDQLSKVLNGAIKTESQITWNDSQGNILELGVLNMSSPAANQKVLKGETEGIDVSFTDSIKDAATVTINCFVINGGDGT